MLLRMRTFAVRGAAWGHAAYKDGKKGFVSGGRVGQSAGNAGLTQDETQGSGGLLKRGNLDFRNHHS